MIDLTQWAREEKFLHAAKLFRIAFMAWIIVHTVHMLPFHETFWSPNAYVMKREFSEGFFGYLFGFVLHPMLRAHYLWIIGLQLAMAMLALFGVRPRITVPLAYILTMNVFNLSGVVLDGGNNLAQLLLLYLSFINTSGTPERNPWLIALSNSVFFLCQAQVAIVYLTAGLLKLNGHLWQNGMAIYYIFQSETFGHPWIAALMRKLPELSMIGTYTTLILQFLFPVLIWFRRFRLPLIVVGLGLHLGIALGMGLLTFGLIMCVSYLLFVPDEVARDALIRMMPSRKILFVAYDQDCRICVRVSNWVAKLDLHGAVKAESAQLPQHESLLSVTLTERLRSLHVVSEEGLSDGFSAVVEIARRLPIAWPALPLLFILDRLGCGEILYRRIADASWRKSCAQGSCSLAQ